MLVQQRWNFYTVLLQIHSGNCLQNIGLLDLSLIKLLQNDQWCNFFASKCSIPWTVIAYTNDNLTIYKRLSYRRGTACQRHITLELVGFINYLQFDNMARQFCVLLRGINDFHRRRNSRCAICTGRRKNIRRRLYIYTVSQKKLGHFFTAYNFRNIEQIFTKFWQKSRSLHAEHNAIIYLNQPWKIVAPSGE